MLIYQNHDSAVKGLVSQPFRLDCHGLVTKAEFEYQRKEAELRRRNSVEHRQGLLIEALLRPGSCHAVAHSSAVGTEMAHNTQRPQAAAGIATQIDY